MGILYYLSRKDLNLESLNEGDFSTRAKWITTGDFDDTFTGEDATYVHNSGSGTLVQSIDNMAYAGVGERWYKFDYKIINLRIILWLVTIFNFVLIHLSIF